MRSRGTPAATASSITSAMKIEQCCPSAALPSASTRERAELRDVLDALEAPPLLLDEGAGPGAAGLVHGRVHDAAAGEPDVLRVLAADLEDGVHPRVVVVRAAGVGGDLVQDEDRVGPVAGGQERADDLAPAAGRAEGAHRPAARRALEEHRCMSAWAAPTGSPLVRM